jgi:N-acetylmuramoyl-L-alanine amidase
MIQIFNTAICLSVKSAFSKFIVVIDDGHGWLTSGKRSVDGSLRENEFNSSIEDKLTLMLNECGIEYYSLASGWADEALGKRSDMEKDLYKDAKARKKETLGISIHADGYDDTSAHGMCVYYFKKGQKISKKGKKLARHVADCIIDSDVKNGHVIAPRHDTGIAGANFHMLRETAGTWCLVENAFMTNDRDLMYLKRDDFRNHRALAIFEGLYKYATLR